MRCMTKNKSEFYYSLYASRESILDEYGNSTGEFNIIRSHPFKYSANISPAQGETNTWQFGENIEYDRVIMMEKDCPPINEYTVLWIDCEPSLEIDGSLSTNENGEVITPHDYVVKAVAKSLNNVAVAISKVNVS